MKKVAWVLLAFSLLICGCENAEDDEPQEEETVYAEDSYEKEFYISSGQMTDAPRETWFLKNVSTDGEEYNTTDEKTVQNVCYIDILVDGNSIGEVIAIGQARFVVTSESYGSSYRIYAKDLDDKETLINEDGSLVKEYTVTKTSQNSYVGLMVQRQPKVDGTYYSCTIDVYKKTKD